MSNSIIHGNKIKLLALSKGYDTLSELQLAQKKFSFCLCIKHYFEPQKHSVCIYTVLTLVFLASGFTTQSYIHVGKVVIPETDNS